MAATMSNYTQGRVKRQRSRPILHWKERDSLPCGVWMDRHITPETVTSPGVRIRMETQFWQPQRGFRYWIPEEIPFVCREAYLRKAWYFRSNGTIGYKDATGNVVSLNQSFGIYQFNNPAGLEKMSGSKLVATAASGNPMLRDKMQD